ncbi:MULTISPECIES: TonB-dependent receptor [Pasteurellaceae]|uniref:TonB-dependent receptor n=1 Tax=Pasteurella bettyae CCUG 2042 TaxID=1095749 RepID=I3DHH8_9PAST|nr:MULTISPECIES: TonB-dependent receptor [Pasteurellaceae]EIJ71171.1 TonB-dependent receptor [Pasteurella bettyae CCUG 2042]SUB20996.1 TonB-dependent receptor, beta-barrel domain protein [Pasteurella bettyae]
MFNKNNLAVAALIAMSGMSYASEIVLEEIQIDGSLPSTKGKLVGNELNSNEAIVEEKTLKQRGATLGNALSGELGIHSSQFGGGASTPIIRGQESKRAKILQNNGENLDMSGMSPDHAVTVDALLAKRIEILRGPTTLLYSAGNTAGVINVVDEKIPTTIPEKGYEGQAGIRFGSASKERLTYLGSTFALTPNLALHVQGLYNKASEYYAPHFTIEGKPYHRVPDSDVQSQTGTIGLSWIGERGHIGMAYTDRRDHYGLIGHTHKYEHHTISIIRQSVMFEKGYLRFYPHLAEESDIDYNNPGLRLLHTHIPGASSTGLEEHVHGKPWIKLHSKRYDFDGELRNPFKGFESFKVSANYVDYYHDEKDGNRVENYFKNKGKNLRFELVHKEWKGLKGAIGLQYTSQLTSALALEESRAVNKQQLLNNPKTKQLSLFAIERWNLGDLAFELSGRAERQKISMDYDVELIDRWLYFNTPMPNLDPHKDKGYSYSFATHWYFAPNHKLTLNMAHQERLPNAQELYAHGKHIAMNAFEAGNKNLKKERSNQIELSLAYVGDKWDYKFNVYHTRYGNYIYPFTLNDNRGPKSMTDEYNLKVNRYYQAKARFSGIEGEIGYLFTPRYRLAVFGDYVRGKLVDLPDMAMGYYIFGPQRGQVSRWEKQPDISAPRVPPLRLGTRFNADFNQNWSGMLEYYRVFAQNKLSKYEKRTPGYHQVNLGVTYSNHLNQMEYQVFLKVDNLLNQKMYQHASYLPHIPQMGRNAMLGVNLSF